MNLSLITIVILAKAKKLEIETSSAEGNYSAEIFSIVKGKKEPVLKCKNCFDTEPDAIKAMELIIKECQDLYNNKFEKVKP